MSSVQHVLFDGKFCSTCGLWRLFDEYPKDASRADGLRKRCKACNADWFKKRRQQNIDLIREKERQYFLDRKEELREYKRTYMAEWQRRNADKVNAKTRRRNARRRGASGSHTKAEWELLCAYYDYRCLCCGMRKTLTADHIVPISHGGGDEIGNIQPLCRNCNSSKSAKTIDYRYGLML